MTVPTQVPAELIAGDTWEWRETLADYPASAWDAAWYFQNAGGAFSVAGVADGDVHTARVEASVTAARKPGDYYWRLTVEQGDGGVPEVITRKTVSEGWVAVTPNPAKGGALDHRSTARVVLEMINAYLSDPTNLAAASYSLAGRSLSRWTRTDLLIERDKWTQEVRSEEAAEAMAKGLGNPRRLYVRWGRV
jgi:hypothetical protein